MLSRLVMPSLDHLAATLDFVLQLLANVYHMRLYFGACSWKHWSACTGRTHRMLSVL